ncbi:efflux RND transporter permease subunit [Micromonospora sp. DH15]|nr:efflux RND transporter permease subunit [Micromonospora sp. DH15]
MLFLSRVSLANRRLVALLTVLLVALGIYAIPSLKQQLLPDLSFPAVTVVASYPGAAPEVVEEQVTGPIEKAVEGIDGVESTTSTSQQGSVQVMVSFSFDSDIDQASTDVEQAVSKISSALPAGVDPQVLTGSTADLPTMVLAATSGGDQHALAAALDEKVVPALRAVDGVNDVAISGVRDQIVTVTPDTAALSKAGLSTQSIVTALGALGGTSSAGQITSDGRNLSLAVGQPVTSLSQLQNMWLSPAASAGSPAAAGRPAAGPGGPAAPAPAAAAPSGAGSGKPVQLKQVATVALTDAPVTSITRTDGKPSLGISLTMDHGGSSPEISDDVRDQLPELQAALGDDARLVVVSDSGPGVKKAVNGLVEEGALGLLMAILVIVVFLRSARATVVTAVSIPLSLLVALIAVWLRDYSLNILTLGALTIAVGRVVDDSIVVLENIKRHLGYGEDRRSAVLSAVREVASAVTSSTLTTVAVFLPIALVGGFVGVLFGSFAITVSAAMLASLLVSLTVVPVLAYWFLKAPADAAGVPADEYRARVEERERQGLLPRVYLPVIRWAVGHRKTVLAGAVALLAATVVMAGGLKTTFLGDSGEDSIGVTLTLPAGASYEIGGVTADQSEAFSQLILAMVAAIALVFLILVGVFRSIRQTLILLVSIPFAFVGAFALLLVTGTPLGVAALIGILMLIGIVVTNAIVLMDLVNQYRERGMSVAEAVVEGAQRRLRPILMTALATIFALLPMALGITGEGGFISTPLAVVVIGGLVTSTLLTLVLIPVLYTMVEGRRERRQARRSSPAPQPETVAEEPVPVA